MKNLFKQNSINNSLAPFQNVAISRKAQKEVNRKIIIIEIVGG